MTDAMFVDIIHSNGDSLLMGGLGSWEAIGHLDFYVSFFLSERVFRMACHASELAFNFILIIS